jgi:hypothetical protein
MAILPDQVAIWHKIIEIAIRTLAQAATTIAQYFGGQF